jgi:hypothetical protein
MQKQASFHPPGSWNLTHRFSTAFWRSDLLQTRLRHAAVAGGIIVVGLILRDPRTGLPWVIAKYAGSILWGAMLYFCVTTCAPRARVVSLLIVAFLIGAVVEITRLYHTPWLDAFRATPAGALLLGRHFSVWNIAAYWLGGLLAAIAALPLRRERSKTAP